MINMSTCNIEQLNCQKKFYTVSGLLNESDAYILLLQEVGKQIQTHEKWNKYHDEPSNSSTIRAVTYVRKTFAASHTIEHVATETTSDRVVLKVNNIRIINIYNDIFNAETRHLSALSTLINSATFHRRTILAGDFNLHHPHWEQTYSNAIPDHTERALDWLNSQQVVLVSPPHVSTHQSGHVIDLVWATGDIAHNVEYTATDTATLSDYYALQWSIRSRRQQLTTRFHVTTMPKLTGLASKNFSMNYWTTSPLDPSRQNISSTVRPLTWVRRSAKPFTVPLPFSVRVTSVNAGGHQSLLRKSESPEQHKKRLTE